MSYRSVTVVFSDSTHTLHLVEIRMEVRGGKKVDHKKAETEAYINVALHKPDINPMDWDIVGVLVTQMNGPNKGRIFWAEDYARNKKENA